MLRILIFCADQSRVLLILGLAAGIGLPGLAAAMAPYLPQMVVVLLVISAFRIGARQALGALSDLRWSLPAVLVLQLAIPLTFALAFMAAGLAHTPLALALVLVTAAPTLAGSASLAILLRQDPARMMQILVLGTALLPVTILAVLSVFPVVSDPWLLVVVGLRSLATILGAAALGFALRHWLLPHPSREQVRALDGAGILFFALIVIGLMTALVPVLLVDPVQAVLWIAVACALGFGLQAATLALLSRGRLRSLAGPLALAAGNRNIALFLVALPPEIMAPVMIFVACWQLPMYLTPILLPRLYAHLPAHE